MRLVTLTKVEERPGESVWVGEGTDEHGFTVRFGGDWRPMQDLANALRYGDDAVVVNVEEWQIL